MRPRIPPATLALSLVAGLLSIILFQGPVRWLATAWVGNPQYTHGFLVLGAAGWLAVRAARRAPRRASDPNTIGLAGLGVGAFLATVGYLRHDPLVSLSGLPLLILGGVAAVHSVGLARRLVFPTLLPLVAVPLPGVDLLTGALQQWSATLATLLVDVAGLDATRAGTRIASGGFLFDVEPLCSGMSGFLSLFALALIIGDVRDLAPRARVLVALAVGPVSLVLNAARIAGTVILAGWTSPETALGWFHTGSGLALFLAGLAVLLAVAQWMPVDRTRIPVSAMAKEGPPDA